jgi:AcrR family transcriptional regulator
MNEPLPLRERHRRATEDAIFDAIERRLAVGSLDELTYLQIAEEAGVSDRTVYRYFPTKEQLLGAFWLRMQQSLGLERSTRGFADYLATRPEAFAEMDRREPVMRALIASTQAREARLRLRDQRQAGIRRVVADVAPHLPEPQFTELCALVHLLGSAPTWQAMKDAWGLEPAQSGPLVARAISILADAFKAAAEADPSTESQRAPS